MGNLGQTDFIDNGENVILRIDPDSEFVQIRMFTSNGIEILQLTNTAALNLGNNNAVLDGSYGRLFLGGSGGHAGLAVLRNANNDWRIQLDAGAGQIYMWTSSGQGAIRLDANAQDQNGAALLTLGYVGNNGTVMLGDAKGATKIRLDAESGQIFMWNSAGQAAISLNADGQGQIGGALLAMGGSGTNGTIVLQDTKGTSTIQLDGESGDIILSNADCAEEFEVANSAKVEPGAVVVIDDQGALRLTERAYDKRVAGVVSGAGGYKPGITLDRRISEANRAPVALVGKVYCKVDASHAAIEVGSLLTTSPTLGHAMCATDPVRAFGAVLGKALSPLKSGTGMIPMLVALQ